MTHVHLFFTVLFLLLTTGVHAQFVDGAPWMVELQNNTSTNKMSNPNRVAVKQADAPRYTLTQIREAFDAYWATRDPEAKGSGYKPFKRWENYWRYFEDQNGNITTQAELWQTWENKANSIGFAANPISSWSSVGPETAGSYACNLTGQGRINAVAIDPTNSNIWYVGSPSGGIWKSTNAGSTWTNLFDEYPSIGVSSIAINPQNTDIIP